MNHVVTAFTDGYPHGLDYSLALFRGLRDNHVPLTGDLTLWVVVDKFPREIRKGMDHFTGDALYRLRFIKRERPVWGWWNLMELFHPDRPWSHEEVCMVGLDTVIKGPTDWWWGHEEPIFLKNFGDHYGYKSTFSGMYADGLVYLPAGNHLNYLWDEYVATVTPDTTYQEMRKFPMHVFNTMRMKEKGYTPMFWQDIWPNRLCSYRMPKPKFIEPEEDLVIFHGSPKVHEAIAQAPWIRKYWKGIS